MASIGGLLGTAGGFNGTGVSAPTNPTDPRQIEDAYKNAQAGLTQQQNFVNAVNPGGQQALQSQQQLLAQLEQGAQGKGPNPALAQLNQTTGQNVANQAALMASQRGASANPALIARQAAQQGAATQQQAAGQGATLAAQQQIQQQQALAQQQAQLVGQQSGALNSYNNAAQNEQNNLLGAQAGINANRTNMIGTATQGQNNLIGGVMGGIGSALHLAEGGAVSTPAIPDVTKGPVSRVGQSMMADSSVPANPLSTGANQFGAALGSGLSSAFKSNSETPTSTGPVVGSSQYRTNAAYAEGGKVPVLLSPGERKLTPDQAKAAAGGKLNPMKAGEKVPGKPKVGGAKNDYANDTQPDEVEAGSIIIPRSVTQGKDAEKKAMAFVRACLAKNGKGMK